MSEDDQENLRANPGYALAQLAKALLGNDEGATKRVQQWQQVLAGMAKGVLQIGSRQPVAGTPPWITLGVIHGGFATGNFAAGGILQQHEIAKLSELQGRGLVPQIDPNRIDVNERRTALNVYFAGVNGREELSDLLRRGCFRVNVPEEAALLISTWLTEHGETDRATELLEVLAPFFDRVRFYPQPANGPLSVMSGDIVYLQPAAFCAKKLRDKRQQESVLKMNESIKVWTPLYDRAVSLFLETLEGEVPQLVRDNVTGELARAANGQPIAGGGWPCKQYPEGWSARVSSFLAEYEVKRKRHQLCKKHEKPKENFARLRNYLAIAVNNPAQLSIRDAGVIRKILASYVTAHGAPGSERLKSTRSTQMDLASRPLHTAMASLLADRLTKEPSDEGVSELERLLVPLSPDEAAQARVDSGTPFPPSIIRKAAPCGEMPLASFVEQRLISSSESLASVLPMLTARIRAARVSDPYLARVIASVYRAFRQRRSLLLLNLESQVRFEELPWISAIEPWVGSSEDSQAAARGALTKAFGLAISAFPYTIVPNKLVKELRTLLKDAGFAVPLVDELAADIFMGSFAPNFLHAAHEAGHLLQGTLYQRYYGIDYEHILTLNDIEERWRAQVSPGFTRICEQMATEGAHAKVGTVAQRGTIIEQAQIITTHNLASLWRALNLRDLPGVEHFEMAQSCFKWICRRQQFKFPVWRTELKSIKNCAYAWRQMLFYISLLSEDQQKQFVSWASDHFNKQSDEFKQRFLPAMNGLVAIVNGEEFDADGRCPSGGQRFLGWSTKPHFLRRKSVVQ